MDALSDVLKSVRLEGAVFVNALHCTLVRTGPVRIPEHPRAAASAEHVMFFHFLTEGSCRLRLARGDETLEFTAGDLALFPQDGSHFWGDLQPTPVGTTRCSTPTIRPTTTSCTCVTVAAAPSRFVRLSRVRPQREPAAAEGLPGVVQRFSRRHACSELDTRESVSGESSVEARLQPMLAKVSAHVRRGHASLRRACRPGQRLARRCSRRTDRRALGLLHAHRTSPDGRSARA